MPASITTVFAANDTDYIEKLNAMIAELNTVIIAAGMGDATQLLGATWAAPGAIGSGSPNTGAFTLARIGTSSPIYSGNEVLSVTAAAGSTVTFESGFVTNAALNLKNSAVAGDNVFLAFVSESNAILGTIDRNRAGGLMRYNTTSDYRSKDLLGAFESAGEIIDAIPVHLGRMKGATLSLPMFVAHEVQEGGAAWAVSGDKDQVDEDGKPVMQGVSKIDLVPVLWAEIQSIRNRMAALEGAA